MSADHDRQSANYCQQCSKPCAGIDEITIDDDFLSAVEVTDDDACVVVEGSVLKLITHADGDSE